MTERRAGGRGPIRVGLVGLGDDAAWQLDALERLEGVDVVAGADVDPARRLTTRRGQLPVHTTPRDLVRAHELDVVVIASPTGTHAEVCRELLALGPGPRLLVEKPLATTFREVTELFTMASMAGRELEPVYHAAVAPEVDWAVRRLDELVRREGSIVSFDAELADPYSGLPAERRRVYVSSWLDSGSNALSIVARFVPLSALRRLLQLDAEGFHFVAALDFVADGSTRAGTIVTTWNVPEPRKETTLAFASGVRLVLNHQRVAAEVVGPDGVADAFRSDEPLPRLTQHYLRAFHQLLIEGTSPYTGAEHLHLLRLLLGESPARPPTTEP